MGRSASAERRLRARVLRCSISSGDRVPSMARTDEPFRFVSQKSSKSANVLHRDLAQLNGFEAPHFSIALPALGLATHLSVAVAVAQADSPHLADDRLLGEATTHHVPRITCDQAGRADY